MFGIFWSIESHFFLQQFLLSSGAILPQQYADQTEHRSFFDWDERFFFAEIFVLFVLSCGGLDARDQSGFCTKSKWHIELSQEVLQQVVLCSLVALAFGIAAIKCKGECSKWPNQKRGICSVGLPSFTQNFAYVTISWGAEKPTSNSDVALNVKYHIYHKSICVVKSEISLRSTQETLQMHYTLCKR